MAPGPPLATPLGHDDEDVGQRQKTLGDDGRHGACAGDENNVDEYEQMTK